MGFETGAVGTRKVLTPPQELIDALKQTKRPVLCPHVRPDADAMGSVLALSLAFQNNGVDARPLIPQQSISRRLAFLTEWADIDLADVEKLGDSDSVIVLDTAKQSRANTGYGHEDKVFNGRPVINVDHHESNTNFGDVNWVVGEASSTSEMVLAIIEAAGWEITPAIASMLFAGIHTDTVGFTLVNTTESSMHAAAKLVGLGARTTELGERLFRCLDKTEFDLLRVFYDNTRLTDDGRIAYSSATYQEITDAGCTAGDVDDQVSVPRSLNGIRMAILFSEGKPNRVRLNLRGERGLSVLGMAKELGGGGHQEAAGSVLECSMEDAIAKVIPMAREHLRKHPES